MLIKNLFLWFMAGEQRAGMPSEEELKKCGLKTFQAGRSSGGEEKGKGKGKAKAGESSGTAAGEITSMLAKLQQAGQGTEIVAQESSGMGVAPGPGLAAVPKRVMEKIWNGEYVDFNELPPAKGKGRSVIQGEGQIVLVQAADLMATKKLIPDLGVWAQCFALYMAILAQKKPEKMPEMLAYLTTISKASTKYRWPSWLIYDHNFRSEAAGDPSRSWAVVDPSLYSQAFVNMSISEDNWCTRCHSLDHATYRCPLRPTGMGARKRQWANFTPSYPPAKKQEREPGAKREICKKYNRYGGDCRYGDTFKHLHACSRCKEEGHPCTECTKANPN